MYNLRGVSCSLIPDSRIYMNKIIKNITFKKYITYNTLFHIYLPCVKYKTLYIKLLK